MNIVRIRALFALSALLALAAPQDAEARLPRTLFELTQREGRELARRPDQAPFELVLLVQDDGTWASGERRGRLAPPDLARVRRAVARTRPGMERRRIALCAGLPSETMRLRTPRGVVTWLTPCSTPPNQATLALMELVQSVTAEGGTEPSETPSTEPPPQAQSAEVLVTYGMQSMEDPMGSDQLTLYTDGRVTWRGGTAQIAPEGMRELERLARTVTLGPVPRDQYHECAARLTGTARIEIRGRGRHDWSLPCGQPHGSIGALLGRIRALAAAR